MSDPAELLGRLRDEFSPDERRALIAALLAEQASSADAEGEPAPSVERVSSAQFVPNTAPDAVIDPRNIDESKVAQGAPEPRDNPDERARLLGILAQFPSGVPGYTLLDKYRIPPETIELARREGQAGRADRGIGLTGPWGGPWAADTGNIDAAAIERYAAAFRERLEARVNPEVQE